MTGPGGTGPTFLVNDGAELRQVAVQDHSQPTFLDEDWDVETPPVVPALVSVAGGLPLLYAGESHMVYGEGGSGKSFFAAHAAAEVARGGGIVLLIDYESNRRTVRERLKALGVTREEAGRIAYWKTSASLLDGRPDRKVLDAWIRRAHPSLVVLDSVAKSMAAAALNESDPGEYIRWQQQVVETWTSQRITSLLIDHTGHQGGSRPGSGRPAARGASSKKDQVSGASYYFEVRKHWTRYSDGEATLTVTKDREGHRKAWSLAATLTVMVAEAGKCVNITLNSGQPQAPKPVATPHIAYMAPVYELLRANQAAPLTGYKVAQHFEARSMSKGAVSQALKALVTEGFVEASEPGPRGRILYRPIKPYPSAQPRLTVPLEELF